MAEHSKFYVNGGCADFCTQREKNIYTSGANTISVTLTERGYCICSGMYRS